MRGASHKELFGKPKLKKGKPIFEERKVNKTLCSEFRVKQDVSSEYYVINFYASSRTLINFKNHRKELLEKRVPDLQRVYGTIFQIKGSKFICDASRLELII